MTSCLQPPPNGHEAAVIEPCRRRGPRRRDTSRPVTRMSTSARRAALSRVLVTPPDHQDSREHQLEGLSPGGGAEWRVVENGGILHLVKNVQAPPNFRHVALWCSSTHVASFRNINHTIFALGETVSSCTVKKIGVHCCTSPRPSTGRRTIGDPCPPPRSDHSAKTRCAVYCDKENDDLTCFMASIEFPCRCAYELHTPADVCWCADVC